MNNCTILGVSHQKRELVDFYMLREQGQPAINFIHFSNPVVVILDGKPHLTEKNACIIYSPGYRQEYRGHTTSFRNDYITFLVDDLDFVSRFGLPENEIFYVSEPDRITQILEWISWAVADKTEPHGEDIYEAIVSLFRTLQEVKVQINPSFVRMEATKQRFIALRDEMRKNPQNWDVDKMSRFVWLTRSRFSVLYKKFFNISPKADLNVMRINYAKQKLCETDETVTDIASLCGYESVEHFIRLFYRREKLTPLKYRQRHLESSSPRQKYMNDITSKEVPV